MSMTYNATTSTDEGCFLESRVVAGVDPPSPDPLIPPSGWKPWASLCRHHDKDLCDPWNNNLSGLKEHGQPMFDPLRLLSLHWGSTNKGRGFLKIIVRNALPPDFTFPAKTTYPYLFHSPNWFISSWCHKPYIGGNSKKPKSTRNANGLI